MKSNIINLVNCYLLLLTAIATSYAAYPPDYVVAVTPGPVIDVTPVDPFGTGSAMMPLLSYVDDKLFETASI